MRKSPVTLTALAAVAAATIAASFAGPSAAEDAVQLRRLPVAKIAAPTKPEPPRPSGPQQLQAKRQDRTTGPGTITAGAPSQLANLIVVPYYNNPNNLPEGFPTHSYCLQKPSGGTPDHIRFYIRNTGATDTGSFQWTPMFPNAGAAPANVIGNIPANGQVLITQGIPNGCYDGNYSAMCQFSIHLDDHNEVPETSEANTYASYCVSPAG